MKVALVHDYLTQRGGAERVVLALLRAFPGAPVHTSLYDPEGTFPEFRDVDVRPAPLDRLPGLAGRHRLAFPLLAPTFSRLRVDADVVVCSSSGWAHGAAATGRKIVYCHTPARWLYQQDRYLGEHATAGARALLAAAGPRLKRWDLAAAASADLYVANSTVVRTRIRDLYGRDAAVVPPPYAVSPRGDARPVDGIAPGFLLCVSRLLPYKNVDAVVDAVRGLDARLVVVGDGPGAQALRAAAPANATVLGTVDDAELRWLYGNARCVLAAAWEDFGLTPIEGAAFGKPTAALRFGGYLDTVVEGSTGTFFERPAAADIREAVGRLLARSWDPARITSHAEAFAEHRFAARMRELVAAAVAEAA